MRSIFLSVFIGTFGSFFVNAYPNFGMTRTNLKIEGRVNLGEWYNVTCVATSAEGFIPKLEWAINYRPVSSETLPALVFPIRSA